MNSAEMSLVADLLRLDMDAARIAAHLNNVTGKRLTEQDIRNVGATTTAAAAAADTVQERKRKTRKNIRQVIHVEIVPSNVDNRKRVRIENT